MMLSKLGIWTLKMTHLVITSKLPFKITLQDKANVVPSNGGNINTTCSICTCETDEHIVLALDFDVHAGAYTTKYGKRLHTDKSCSYFHRDKRSEITEHNAANMQKWPICKRCAAVRARAAFAQHRSHFAPAQARAAQHECDVRK
jgi:hypothetical protein